MHGCEHTGIPSGGRGDWDGGGGIGEDVNGESGNWNGGDGGCVTVQHPSQLHPRSTKASHDSSANSKHVAPAHGLAHVLGSNGDGDGGGAGGGEGAGMRQTAAERSARITPGKPMASLIRCSKVAFALLLVDVESSL